MVGTVQANPDFNEVHSLSDTIRPYIDQYSILSIICIVSLLIQVNICMIGGEIFPVRCNTADEMWAWVAAIEGRLAWVKVLWHY